jgi:hypothetical protein
VTITAVGIHGYIRHQAEFWKIGFD